MGEDQIEFGSRRRVLLPGPGEAEAEAFCAAHAWRRVAEGWLDPQTKREYKITWSCGPAVQFHYVEDDLAGQRYVQTSGSNLHILNLYAGFADEELPIWQLEDLIEQVDLAADPIRRGLALIRLGVGAPPILDDAVFTRIAAGLADSAKEVRDMSILASLYAAYSSLRPLLRSVSENDEVQDLRDRAGAILAAFDNMGVRTADR
ncbi:hypothetical protein D5S18_22490 [Nocardia panacis]|uniref:Uncharacterized protein n=1 Tax=Nocardia panacis TaxID=2340916 RepID=A0A3A4KRM4_9NOCA|nr:hypothetical protein [Nocardia panacis]RJO72542.1 hypothetical protein D5S18_22490 [Nocardia panacis]